MKFEPFGVCIFLASNDVKVIKIILNEIIINVLYLKMLLMRKFCNSGNNTMLDLFEKISLAIENVSTKFINIYCKDFLQSIFLILSIYLILLDINIIFIQNKLLSLHRIFLISFSRTYFMIF